MDPNSIQEATAAGLQCLQHLITILSSQSQSYQTNTTSSSPPSVTTDDYIADAAVNKFKKFISLLDRNRTGHARFCRGPVSNHNKSSPANIPATAVVGEKVYSPAPIQQRLPPPLVQTNINAWSGRLWPGAVAGGGGWGRWLAVVTGGGGVVVWWWVKRVIIFNLPHKFKK